MTNAWGAFSEQELATLGQGKGAPVIRKEPITVKWDWEHDTFTSGSIRGLRVHPHGHLVGGHLVEEEDTCEKIFAYRLLADDAQKDAFLKERTEQYQLQWGSCW
jgi:hypothetical protein